MTTVCQSNDKADFPLAARLRLINVCFGVAWYAVPPSDSLFKTAQTILSTGSICWRLTSLSLLYYRNPSSVLMYANGAKNEVGSIVHPAVVTLSLPAVIHRLNLRPLLSTPAMPVRLKGRFKRTSIGVRVDSVRGSMTPTSNHKAVSGSGANRTASCINGVMCSSP